MRSAISGLIFLLMLGCGTLMTFWYFAALIDWLGVVFGILVGVFVTLGVVVFPLPSQSLWTWLAGMACLVGMAFSRN